MAEIFSEQEVLIRLADVPKLGWLPTRRGGKRLNVSTVFRWAQIGLRGVRLEAVRAGNCLCTSEAALRRFFERLTDPEASSDSPTPSQVQRWHKAAEKHLDAANV